MILSKKWNELCRTCCSCIETCWLLTSLHNIIHFQDGVHFRLHHDDVIKWKHISRYWPFVWGIHRSLGNSPHNGQWLGALMLSLICAWTNGWANNWDADDLRHHHALYDVTVMRETDEVPFNCVCSGSAGASVVAHSVALPLIEIAFSTLDCSIVPTCGAWGSATAAKRGPLKQSWVGIQHSRDDEPLGVLMQMRNVNGFFLFSSLGVLPGVLVDTLSLCSGNFWVECVLIVLHKFYIEL